MRFRTFSFRRPATSDRNKFGLFPGQSVRITMVIYERNFVLRYVRGNLGNRGMARKMKRRLAELNGEMEKVTAEIEHLSLIRDNRLKFSVYKSFLDRKYGEHGPNPKRLHPE